MKYTLAFIAGACLVIGYDYRPIATTELDYKLPSTCLPDEGSKLFYSFSGHGSVIIHLLPPDLTKEYKK